MRSIILKKTERSLKRLTVLPVTSCSYVTTLSEAAWQACGTKRDAASGPRHDPTDTDERLTAEMLSETAVVEYHDPGGQLDALRSAVKARDVKPVARGCAGRP